jgi:hypothetical protein
LGNILITATWLDAGKMLGWGSNAAVEKRAKLLARMVALIMHGLETKTYEQFIASFSNPGAEPDASERQRYELHFRMRIAPKCGYDGTACYLPSELPWATLRGHGDDFGVFITIFGVGTTVGLHLNSGERAGCDACVIVRSLTTMPGFRSFSALERSLG